MVGDGIADQEAGLDASAGAGHCRAIGARVGLADRQRIRADKCREVAGQAQLVQQVSGQTLGLVGAYAKPPAVLRQPLQRFFDTGIGPREFGYIGRIMCQKSRVIDIKRIWRQQHILRNARIAGPQHCPCALKGNQKIGLRIKQIIKSAAAEAGIGRSDQVRRCVDQRPVEVEDYSSCHIRVTIRRKA